MKITSFSPNGLQLTRMGLMNCYLVREPDGGSGAVRLILRSEGQQQIPR
jgi:hypothetical protein